MQIKIRLKNDVRTRLLIAVACIYAFSYFVTHISPNWFTVPTVGISGFALISFISATIADGLNGDIPWVRRSDTTDASHDA